MCRGRRGCWFELKGFCCQLAESSYQPGPAVPVLFHAAHAHLWFVAFIRLASNAALYTYSTGYFLAAGLDRRPIGLGLPCFVRFRGSRVAANSADGLLHTGLACSGGNGVFRHSNQAKAAPVVDCDSLCNRLCGHGNWRVHCDGVPHGGAQINGQPGGATVRAKSHRSPLGASASSYQSDSVLWAPEWRS